MLSLEEFNDRARSYYRDRLEDVTLLDKAVELDLGDGRITVAVPVGGRRQSGWCGVHPLWSAPGVASLMARPHDFPDLRYDDECENLVWGAEVPLPEMFDEQHVYERAVGEQFGYSDAAINDHLKRLVEYLAGHRPAPYLEPGEQGEPTQEEPEWDVIRPVTEVEEIYFDVLENLKRWGCIIQYGHNGATGQFVVTTWNTQDFFFYDADEVENWVSGMVEGWLRGRTVRTPLAEDEKDRIVRSQDN